MVEGVRFTVNVLVTKQPVEALTTVIFAVPEDIPFAAPVEGLICATAVSLELHTRVPVVAVERTANEPTHTAAGPDMAEGAGLTTITLV